MSEEKIVLIDICGTLFQSNTTFDFLHYFLRKDKRYLQFEHWRKLRVVGFVNHYVFRFFGIDIMRNVALSFLKGYTYEHLLREADKFCHDYLNKRRNEQVFHFLEEWRHQGQRIVLASATIDCVAHAVSKYCNIPLFFSTKLSYDNQVCTGKIKTDLLGKKQKKIHHSWGYSHFDMVITDNFSDLDIINHADCAILVQYTKSKNKWLSLTDKITSKWQILEI